MSGLASKDVAYTAFRYLAYSEITGEVILEGGNGEVDRESERVVKGVILDVSCAREELGGICGRDVAPSPVEKKSYIYIDYKTFQQVTY